MCSKSRGNIFRVLQPHHLSVGECFARQKILKKCVLQGFLATHSGQNNGTRGSIPDFSRAGITNGSSYFILRVFQPTAEPEQVKNGIEEKFE